MVSMVVAPIVLMMWIRKLRRKTISMSDSIFLAPGFFLLRRERNTCICAQLL